MPRYLVERCYGDGFAFSPDATGAELCETLVERNGELGVTWFHSYVSADKRITFDLYDAPTPESIRKTAARNHQPIERIIEVTVLDPYFCR